MLLFGVKSNTSINVYDTNKSSEDEGFIGQLGKFKTGWNFVSYGDGINYVNDPVIVAKLRELNE